MAIINFDFYSHSVMKTVHAIAILPVFTGNTDAEFPLKSVYYLPGFSESAQDAMNFGQLRRYSEEFGIATIAIDGDNSFYVDRPMRMYSTLVHEVVETTRKVFPLSDRREDTYIAGMSMGGYGALYNGLKYQNLFSKIALLAPGLDVYDVIDPQTNEKAISAPFLDSLFGSEENYHATDFNYRNVLPEAMASNNPLELFYSLGETDALVAPVVDQFTAFLKEKDIKAQYFSCAGGHDRTFGSNAAPAMYRFLSGNSNH